MGQAQAAAEAVIVEAQELIEVSIDAKDELEPEDAASDAAVAPLVDQYGVIIRVSDQDDNSVSDIMKVRVVGPAEPAEDAATLLRARFVQGKATTAVLQTRD